MSYVKPANRRGGSGIGRVCARLKGLAAIEGSWYPKLPSPFIRHLQNSSSWSEQNCHGNGKLWNCCHTLLRQRCPGITSQRIFWANARYCLWWGNAM